MSDKNIVNSVFVSIDNIGIIKASIDNRTNIIELEAKKYLFKMTFSMELALNVELKKIRTIFICDVEALEKESGKAVGISGKFEIAFFYTVENLVNIVGSGPEFKQNEDLEKLISEITYSTARGIVFTRCQGTPLKFWLIPILDDETPRKREVVTAKKKTKSKSKNQ